ncbi:MAG: cysteine desulfurase [Candidatus Woesearchaeota archaeon]
MDIEKNLEKIRNDFHFEQIYFDNAASTLKPKQVIQAMNDFFLKHYANTHRGLYRLSEEATELFEDSRRKVAEFVNAKPEEIVFVKNTTEGINLIANSLTDYLLEKEKEINVTISELEHHSNIVPWQILAKKKKIMLDFVKIDKNTKYIDVEDLEKKVKNTDILSITASSNVTGKNINKETLKIAKRARFLILDLAQYIPHHEFNLKAHAFAFSGHKMLASTGIGVLKIDKDLAKEIPPFLGGGEMISKVTKEDFSTAEIPQKFEAGTQPFVEAYSLKAAIDYLNKLGMKNIEKYEKKLRDYLYERLTKLNNIELISEPDQALFAFRHKKLHCHDVSALLNEKNIATRSGFHCAMPLHNALNFNQGSVRASLYFYNTFEEIDMFVDVLKKI